MGHGAEGDFPGRRGVCLFDLFVQILNLDPENVKALSRGAKCRRCRDDYGDLDIALQWIELAAQREPKDRSILEEKRTIRKLVAECVMSSLRSFLVY